MGRLYGCHFHALTHPLQQWPFVAGVRQFFATSLDGTKVPYFQLSKKGMAYDGSNPTLFLAFVITLGIWDEHACYPRPMGSKGRMDLIRQCSPATFVLKYCRVVGTEMCRDMGTGSESIQRGTSRHE